MTTAQNRTTEFMEMRRDPSVLRGALSLSPNDGFLLLLSEGRSVKIDDDRLDSNSHRRRWLVVDGDHIGARMSWQALERLARRCCGCTDEQLSALKLAEMDRESRPGR